MDRVVYVSAEPPRGGLSGVLSGLALLSAVVGAGIAGWNTGGILLAILYSLVTLVIFPFLLTFLTILFLAFYPLLAWPGSVIADWLGWTWNSPHVLKRMWLRRISVVAVLLPVLILLERNAIGVLGVVAGVATFTLAMLGLLVALPLLLFLGLFFYALFRNRPPDGSESTIYWTPPDPPRLPPAK